jgi:hypothetical protein
MIARIITYANAQLGLLAAQPNWETEIKVSLELPTDVSKEPITFSESRRNFAQSARYRMEWTSYISNSADSTELRLFLNRVREVPIIAPLWPDVCELQSNAPIHATHLTLADLPAREGVFWIVTDENFTQWEIVQRASLDLTTKVMVLSVGLSRAYPAGTRLYPIILGRLEDRPQAEAITDETMELSFKIKESSNFAARITPVTSAMQIVGTNIPEFATALKWTVTPNHSRPMDWTEMPDIIYEQVGFLREEKQRVYDHNTARGQELEFYQNERGSIARIEYFWRLTRATTLRFMIPTYRGDLRMLTNTPVPGHPTWIECERNFFSNPGRDPQLGDPYIALINKNDVVTPYKVQVFDDVGGNKTRLVASTAVTTFVATTTIVSHLLLARFADPKLEWTYTTPYMGTTRIKFQEVPQEYPNNIVPVPPPPLPESAYLFIFTEAGIRTDRFTSYENTVTINSGIYQGSYQPAPFSFDTEKTGLKLDQEKLDLKSFKFDGNPLNKMWPFALDAILTLEIVEVWLNPTRPDLPPSRPVSRFFGDVWSVDSEYKATIIPFGNLFDRKFPRFLLSVSDNYTQFSPPTMLSPSAFQVSGTVHGTVNHLSQTLVVNSTAGHSKAADYFAGGWLETGAGVSKEKRGILHSAPTGTVDVTLTIDRPLLKAGTNQALTMYPGYDGSIDQCESKFNNRINFGGHPFIPNVNPGVKAIKPKETQGGKKG